LIIIPNFRQEKSVFYCTNLNDISIDGANVLVQILSLAYLFNSLKL